MGCFGCCQKYLSSELDKYGLGITSYFKTLKSLLWCFGIITFINIIVYYVYINTHFETEYRSINEFLFKSTVGNVASCNLISINIFKRIFLKGIFFIIALFNCQKIEADQFFSQNFYNFRFNCSEYEFIKISDFGIPPDKSYDIENSSNCVNFTSSINLFINQSCKLDNITNSLLDLNCSEKSICNVSLATSELKKKCNLNYENKNLYLSYMCFDKYIEIGNYKLDRNILAYVISSIDALGIIIILVTIIIILCDYSRLEKIYSQNNKFINEYTVNIKNLNIEYANIDDEIESLITHFDNLIKTSFKKFLRNFDRNSCNNSNSNNSNNYSEEAMFYNGSLSINTSDLSYKTYIYEINFPYMTKDKLTAIVKRENLIKEYISLKTKLDLYLLERNLYNDDKKIERLEKGINNVKNKIISVQNDLKRNDNQHIEKINDIFITFFHTKFAKYIFNSYNKSKFTRFWYFFCCSQKRIKKFYYKDQWLKIEKNPDNPSNINWQNMIIGTYDKIFLKFLSVVLSIFLILISFGIVITGKYFQELLDKEFDNNVDCKFIDYDINSVRVEFFTQNIPKRNRLKTFCFCREKLTEIGIFKLYDFTFPENQNVFPCKDWLMAFIQYNFINYGIIFSIPILNALITYLLTKLTNYEKNKSLTEDKSSNMIKIFIGQFINTGIVIFLVNIKINFIKNLELKFPIFNGFYDDLNSGWFKNIGSTIFFTMIISVFSPHLGILANFLFTSIKRLSDSCNLIGNSSKIKDYKSFTTLYLGPELMIDSRYAQVSQLK